jgi:hypothetical protein
VELPFDPPHAAIKHTAIEHTAASAPRCTFCPFITVSWNDADR